MNDKPKHYNNQINQFSNFNPVTIKNSPLNFLNVNPNNAHQQIQNTTPSQNPTILSSYLNSSRDNISESININNDFITEVEIQNNLKVEDIVLINSRNKQINNSNGDYLHSQPFPNISEETFKDYLKKEFDDEDLGRLSQTINQLIINSNYNSTIGPFSSFENLIELICRNKPELLSKVKQEKQCLKGYIYQWRKVKGDGNCFYRAVMFSFLETIILHNDIQLLRNLIMDIKKCYSDESIKPKLAIKTGYVINYTTLIKILIIIHSYLHKGKIKEAYDVFIKCMLTCDNFDFGLIFYLRYILYQYTKKNETMLYTENCPVLIGNLLPKQYETDGIFLFEDYYEKYLLQMFKDAEKIVIYLVPFVLCIQLNVVLFEVNQNHLKIFNYYGSRNNKSNYSINIANLKEHYELIYSKPAFEKFEYYYKSYQLKASSSSSNQLLIKRNDNVNSKVKVNQGKIIEHTNSGDDDDNDESYNHNSHESSITNFIYIPKPARNRRKDLNSNTNSNITSNYNQAHSNINANKNYSSFNQVQQSTSTLIYNLSDDPNSSSNNKNNNNQIQFNDFGKNNNNNKAIEKQQNKIQQVNQTMISANTIKCSRCESPYKYQTDFKLCTQCLLNELKDTIFAQYTSFLFIAKNDLSKSDSFESRSIFIKTFQQDKVTIKGKDMLIEDIIKLINKDNQTEITFNQLLKGVKSSQCLNCGDQIINQSIKLPCDCCFCKTVCQKQYYSDIQTKLNDQNFDSIYTCLCTYKYSPNELLNVITGIAQYADQIATKFFEVFKKISGEYCSYCLENENFGEVVTFECANLPKEIEKYLKIYSIMHNFCLNCYLTIKQQSGNLYYCSICKMMHKLKISPCSLM